MTALKPSEKVVRIFVFNTFLLNDASQDTQEARNIDLKRGEAVAC